MLSLTRTSERLRDDSQGHSLQWVQDNCLFFVTLQNTLFLFNDHIHIPFYIKQEAGRIFALLTYKSGLDITEFYSIASSLNLSPVAEWTLKTAHSTIPHSCLATAICCTSLLAALTIEIRLSVR